MRGDIYLENTSEPAEVNEGSERTQIRHKLPPGGELMNSVEWIIVAVESKVRAGQFISIGLKQCEDASREEWRALT